MSRALPLVFLGAALLANPAPAADAPDWFRAVQYTSRGDVVLRGCSECQGEPDDRCEVRRGAQAQTLEQYARQRWPAAGRVKLLRSRADPDCAVPATGPKGLFGPASAIEVAAIRMATTAPSTLLLERFQPRLAVRGWPHAPQRRKGEQPQPAHPQRSSLRLALVCWPAEQGWPNPRGLGLDGRAALERTNACEWWLLPVKPAGEPDVEAQSFPLDGTPWPAPFSYGDGRWPRAFDRSSPLDDAVLLGEVRAEAEPAAAPPPPDSLATGTKAAACGGAARAKLATLERFDQWDTQLRGSSRRSLDRGSWTLNAAAWTGHCQELDALRAALEQQLGCAVAQQGRCAGAEEPR
ncbi:MAG: hypothetical protein ACJ79H_18890 [Myxococcales bacterium]